MLGQFKSDFRGPDKQAGVYGVDSYSRYTTIDEVLKSLHSDAVVTGRYQSCEDEAVVIGKDLLAKRSVYRTQDGDRFFDVAQNARLPADAASDYRVIYSGGVES